MVCGQGKIYSKSKVSRTDSDRSDIFHVPSSSILQSKSGFKETLL
jgi:hypothetical protein